MKCGIGSDSLFGFHLTHTLPALDLQPSVFDNSRPSFSELLANTHCTSSQQAGLDLSLHASFTHGTPHFVARESLIAPCHVSIYGRSESASNRSRSHLYHAAFPLLGHLNLNLLPAHDAVGQLEGKFRAISILGPEPIPWLDPICSPLPVSINYCRLNSGWGRAIRQSGADVRPWTRSPGSVTTTLPRRFCTPFEVVLSLRPLSSMAASAPPPPFANPGI